MSNEVGCEDKELFQLSNGRYIMSEELSDKMFYIKRIQPESYQPDNTGYSWDESGCRIRPVLEAVYHSVCG